MTTARKRYEQKTKVVTFRVRNDIYDQIQDFKAKTRLSYADLVKLGAGIGQAEIKAKLAEVSGLENRLSQLKAAIRQREQQLDKVLAEQKKRRLAELDTEMEAFKLFDQRWELEAVSFKMGIPYESADGYFREWGDARNNKEAIERQLLKECLMKHLDMLKQRRYWAQLPPGYPEYLEEVQEEIDHYQHLLQHPTKISDDEKAFLLATYAREIQPARTKKID